jgi:mRNA interferase MazF
MYEQREVVLIPFPYSDLTGSKQRPALIISNEKINKTEDRICCLITTSAHESDLLITKDSFEKGTLPFKSWVKPHRIFTIHKDIVRKKLCVVSSKFHDKVIEKVNEYLRKDMNS